ncbi:hypothetical protein C2E23DRAFT_569974 [Lenzites betulinus]|nr:hypothetical protein C2E23DRAFT_569974 [Lenzites betulinus]
MAGGLGLLEILSSMCTSFCGVVTAYGRPDDDSHVVFAVKVAKMRTVTSLFCRDSVRMCRTFARRLQSKSVVTNGIIA